MNKMENIAGVIIAHNEEKTIMGTILSLFKQKNVSLTQIFVIANACTDNTVGVVDKLKQGNIPIKIIDLEEKGKVKAFNYFVRYLNEKCDKDYRYFIFVDADIIIKDKYAVSKLIKGFEKHSGCYVISGNGIPISDRNRGILYNLYWLEYLIRKHTSYNSIRGYFYAITSDVLKKVTIPDELISDDTFIEYLLDGRLYLNKKIEVYHRLDSSIKKDIIRQIRAKFYIYHMYKIVREKGITKLDISLGKKYEAKYWVSKSEILPIIKMKPIKYGFYAVLLYFYSLYSKYLSRKYKSWSSCNIDRLLWKK